MQELIAEAIIAQYGERCPEFDADCILCQVWSEYDDLVEHRIVIESLRSELEAVKREAVEVLKPFGLSYVAETVDGNGWTSGVQKEAIHVWFGPSDFRAARAFVEKHGKAR